MSYLSDYYAAKDAERSDGSVDLEKVPARNGGYLITDHPEDEKWWDGDSPKKD